MINTMSASFGVGSRTIDWTKKQPGTRVLNHASYHSVLQLCFAKLFFMDRKNKAVTKVTAWGEEVNLSPAWTSLWFSVFLFCTLIRREAYGPEWTTCFCRMLIVAMMAFTLSLAIYLIRCWQKYTAVISHDRSEHTFFWVLERKLVFVWSKTSFSLHF